MTQLVLFPGMLHSKYSRGVSTGLALPLEEGAVQCDAAQVGGGLDRLEDEPHGNPVGRVAAQRARQR